MVVYFYSITEHFRRCKRNARIRKAIEPMTGQVISDTTLIANDDLRMRIHEEIQKKIAEFSNI